MFKNKFLISTLLIFMWMPFLFAQTESIDLINRGIANYQDIFVSDLDILNTGSAKDLFGIQLNKSVGDMNGEITINLTKDNKLLATIETNRFQFPNSSGPWTFTNVELSKGTFNFNGQGGSIRVSDTQTFEENSSKVIKEMESTLKVPFGTYELTAKLEFYTPEGIFISSRDAREEIIINITNPYILSQITPGNTLNSGFVYELYTLNPVFQWNGNSGLYQIAVFKKQSDFSTPEDILNSQPVWESDKINTLFRQYPPDGSVPLEYGAEYVWQVRSFVSTSSGENIIQSELWEFTIVDPSASGTTAESMAQQEFENLLRQLLGDNAEPIIRELSSFHLSIMRVNGEILSTPELYKYLDKYRDQENEISDIILRSSN